MFHWGVLWWFSNILYKMSVNVLSCWIRHICSKIASVELLWNTQVYEFCDRSLGDIWRCLRLGHTNWWKCGGELPYIWLGWIATVMDSHKCQSLYLSQAPARSGQKSKVWKPHFITNLVTLIILEKVIKRHTDWYENILLAIVKWVLNKCLLLSFFLKLNWVIWTLNYPILPLTTVYHLQILY